MESGIPYGAPHSAGIMHNTLLAVLFILDLFDIDCIGYIDDEAAVNDNYQSALVDFIITLTIYRILGLTLAEKKLVLPSKEIIWLGVKFNTTEMSMSLPREKMLSTVDLCQNSVLKR